MQERLSLGQTIEYFESEGLKSLGLFGAHSLAKFQAGQHLLELASGGARIEDPRLHTTFAGIEFENPVGVGAGFDKKGRNVDSNYRLGFGSTEVGSVLVHPQPGNPRPRMYYDRRSGVGLNSLGFNADGEDAVADNLDGQNRSGRVGINMGKNKVVPDAYAPWAYAAVADRLYDYADYLVINPSSPNTPGLRSLLQKEPLTDIVQAVQEVITSHKDKKPLAVKTTVDQTQAELDETLGVLLDLGVEGIIHSNTTSDEVTKKRYGWGGKPGGVSGNDPIFRVLANQQMRYITRETRGTGLQRIGVGGIHDAETAMERIRSGAQLVQVVTGIRESWGRVARAINLELVITMGHHGVKSVTEYIGIDAGLKRV